MKVRLVFACAATGIALMAFGATTASAEPGSGTFKISPGVVRPGDSVSLSATCDYSKFTAPAQIESGALVTTNLTGEKGKDGVWRLTGKTTVRPDVAPGAWSALFQCGPNGGVVVADFKVEAAAEKSYAAIGIDDDVIKPGQEVRVSASCQDPRFASSKIVSPVVVAPDLIRKKGEPVDNVLSSMGRIAVDAKPGTYPISFTCVGREVSGKFTVVADKKPAAVTNQVSVKPKGAADTGSLDQPAAAASAADDSPSYVLIGAGAAALLAAGGAGVWAHRRRRRV
jgi:hypothetical protein